MNDTTNDTIIKVSRNTDIAPQNSLSTQTVAFSHYNYISAQLPVNITTGALVANDIKVQAAQCLKNIKTIVESIDHDMNDVIKINIFLKNIADIKDIDTIYPAFFQGYLPTRTVIAVAELPINNALVQMDAVISNGEGTYPQAPVELVKVPRNNENVPKDSVSPHTIAFSHYNNISAQLPVDTTTGKLVTGGIKAQTQQCLKNIEAILDSIDVPLQEIVKVNIFLKDVADVDAVNDVYKTFFPETTSTGDPAYLPALTIVIASDLQLDALVQVDAIVSHGDGTPPQATEDKHGITIKANNTDKAPKSPLSTQTVAFSHYNHLSGQLPINPETGKLIDGDIKAQTKQCLENIKAIVESTDHVMDDVVKMTIQLNNIKDIDTVNEVYKTFFDNDLPARTVIGVAAIPMDALIQIDTVVSNAEGTPPAS
ncbi:RidA family protein [uncultured Psychrobacter sp.]|uniref:RidA family protein n=1 Tax=uncultured Psychrobacter sp. TaxID=259303 RepID=UPI0026068169|nr:RidA family protein [uncultured Psychrobacter sp.]